MGKKLNAHSYPAELLQLMLAGSEKPVRVYLPSRSDAVKIRAKLYGMRKRLEKAEDVVVEMLHKVSITILPDGEYERGCRSGIELAPNFHDFVQHIRASGILPEDDFPPEAVDAHSPAPDNTQSQNSYPHSQDATKAEVALAEQGPGFEDVMKTFMKEGDSDAEEKG